MFTAARGLVNNHLFKYQRISVIMSNTSTRLSLFSTNATSSPTKRVLGTHNGTFHCDEALACFMLRLTNNFSASDIVRTRDPKPKGDRTKKRKGFGLMFTAARGLVNNHLNNHLFKYQRISVIMSNTSTRLSLFSTNATSSPTKRVLGTHNGTFHCDEALACFMLRLTNNFSASDIVRTRDPKVLETLDAVLDVGGVYDPSNDRYDHHQKGFSEVFGHGFITKLSSAGLIYKHYGMEIVAKELQLDEGHPDVLRLYLGVYKYFMEAIDAVDNGINQFDTEQPPKYVNNTNLSARVGRLNLDWMDPDQSSEKENEAFHKAMALTGSEFLDSVRFHAKSWLPARSIVMECLAARQEIDPSGEIIVLNRFCPWKLHLFELEEEMKIDPLIKYVLYQDDRSKNWRIQAVAVAPDKFESRMPLPSQWRGLRDDELSKEAGIPGCVFAHMSGFIGGNKTYEGVLAMAKEALKVTNTGNQGNSILGKRGSDY